MAYIPESERAFTQEELPTPHIEPSGIVDTPSGPILQTGDFTSPNYRTGRSGWKVDSRGNAEFQNVTVASSNLLTADATLANLQVSADTVDSTTSTSFIKLKEIFLVNGGIITYTFDMKAGTNSTIHGRVYINNVAVGTDQTTASITYVTFQEDIYCPAGSFVQLWAIGLAGFGASYRNFRLYYTVTPNVKSKVTLN